jgi:hypothetical protein
MSPFLVAGPFAAPMASFGGGEGTLRLFLRSYVTDIGISGTMLSQGSMDAGHISRNHRPANPAKTQFSGSAYQSSSS